MSADPAQRQRRLARGLVIAVLVGLYFLPVYLHFLSSVPALVAVLEVAFLVGSVVMVARWLRADTYRHPGRLASWMEGWTGSVGLTGPMAWRRALAVPRPDQAERLLRGAARQGHAGAAYELARFLQEAGGVEGQTLSAPAFRRAAELGHAEAAYEYAERLRWGAGVTQDADAALPWYEKAARGGFRPAAQWLADTCPEPRRAEAWARAAANLPEPEPWTSPLRCRREEEAASGLLALMADESLGRVRRFWDDALESGRFPLVMAGILALLGLTFYLAGAFRLVLGLVVGLTALLITLALFAPALRWVSGGSASGHASWRTLGRLEARAGQGEPQAALELGLMYLNGSADLAREPHQAFHWLSRAAEGGNREAMAHLADLYAWGHGVGKDLDLAAQWRAQAQEITSRA